MSKPPSRRACSTQSGTESSTVERKTAINGGGLTRGRELQRLQVDPVEVECGEAVDGLRSVWLARVPAGAVSRPVILAHDCSLVTRCEAEHDAAD
eukprot:CAMPEP_0183375724 /NCGR_PEP_ID=MMETSP0164_2-20130417/118214_1 /TAXON_ID=221442 /ORGANISM="Coccolithus pelagicus ssp braarudi, Strain PLY182g" /LENGTH=94 /DNA_ID=CAMNT_0025552923 /DNA_START=96 /DNA_END=379 /DNA_ORIENTATION=+